MSASTPLSFVEQFMKGWRDAQQDTPSELRHEEVPVYAFGSHGDVIITALPPALVPTSVFMGRELGRGTFGVVSAAYAGPTLRPIALKQVTNARDGTKVADKNGKKGGAQEPMPFLQLAREVSNLMQLRHPNVMRADAAFTHNGALYIVCEFAPFTLTRLIEPGAGAVARGSSGVSGASGALRAPCVTERELRWVLRQVMEGLVCACERGILHRDVKLANILLDRDPRPSSGSNNTGNSGEGDDGDGGDESQPLRGAIAKIADFGLSRQADLLRNRSVKHTRVGSPLMMSDELLRDQAKLGDVHDVYSVGVAMFHLLTGFEPFGSGDIDKARDQAHLMELRGDDTKRRRPGDICTGVSAAAADLYDRLTHRVSAHRPSLKDALRHPFFAPTYSDDADAAAIAAADRAEPRTKEGWMQLRPLPPPPLPLRPIKPQAARMYKHTLTLRATDARKAARKRDADRRHASAISANADSVRASELCAAEVRSDVAALCAAAGMAAVLRADGLDRDLALIIADLIAKERA